MENNAFNDFRNGSLLSGAKKHRDKYSQGRQIKTKGNPMSLFIFSPLPPSLYFPCR